jgi:hypothetical protein
MARVTEFHRQQVTSLLWDLGMSSLVSLFYCMTLIYFSYSAILYKVVLAYMGDLFLCSSFVHHLEAPILDEQGLSIYLTNDLLMSSVFVHKLEARVLHEHNPSILLYRHSRTRIRLYA